MPAVIDRDQVQQMLADGAQLLEALAREEFAEEHLPGAVNVPLAEIAANTTAHLDREQPIIVYCYDLE